MTYGDSTNFSFSIPNQPVEEAEQHLSQLLQKMRTAKIKLRSISGFASGQRIKLFCVPEDANKFRAFLKSARIRAKEVGGFAITDEVDVLRAMAVLDFIALSGFNIRAFDVMGAASKAGGFVW